MKLVGNCEMQAIEANADHDTTPFYVVEVEQALATLQTDGKLGLRSDQAQERLAQFGPNELPQEPPVPLWRKLFRQFNELVIWLLVVAAFVSGVMSDWADAFAILAIVIVNGILGFVQEEKAERALGALRKLSVPLAKVIRDGLPRVVPARELVPGDRVELEAGDRVPADLRLIASFGLQIQEAALTGESVPVEKQARAQLAATAPLAERRNMAYLGTVVATGKANAVVMATGMKTELGQIAGLLQRYEPEATPLQRRLAELGRVLVGVCLAIVTVIFILQVLRGGELLQVFLTAVSLAVAAVPEGLPAVVTLALAVGLQRMVRRNALVRTLPSVETLGSVTVICSDKTGTLTRNEMTVRVVVAGGTWYDVSGVGYAPQGEFVKKDTVTAIAPAAEPDLELALTIAARCNNARVTPSSKGRAGWEVVGDPTEGALLVVAMKGGIEGNSPSSRLLYEIPFDSERKAMSVVLQTGDGKSEMYTKGAPEIVLAKCTAERRDGVVVGLSDVRRQEIGAIGVELASRALRVLALAYRGGAPDKYYEETELIFVGLVGMIDPPRDEVRVAVEHCHAAGIRPVMITGDHPATALAIARELGLIDSGHVAVTGNELDAMTDPMLRERVGHIAVFARVSAEHKLRVVKALKHQGEMVAMTGDGVNDAPAVKAADIGIAMGITGTDVTKEAADMVLVDDNFASIVGAVEEGRGILDNIQKSVHYLLACNTGEVLFMFFAALVGWPSPLMAIQLLWINLVTDGLPALALGVEPPERGIMSRPPRPPREPVITLGRGVLMLFHGALVAAVSGAGFWLVYQGDISRLNHARTVAFCTVSYTQLFLSFACRSQRLTLPQLGIFSNPYLLAAIAISALLQLSVVTLPFARPVFEVSGHPGHEWLLVLFLALTPVTVVELSKLTLSRRYKRSPTSDA